MTEARILEVLDPMETLDRFDRGTDWGAKRRLLARTTDSDVRLFVREGCYAAVNGVRGFGREYMPMAVKLWSAKSWSGFASWQDTDVGANRLDLEAIRREHGELIDRVFGCPGLSARLQARRTIVVASPPGG